MQCLDKMNFVRKNMFQVVTGPKDSAAKYFSVNTTMIFWSNYCLEKINDSNDLNRIIVPRLF